MEFTKTQGFCPFIQGDCRRDCMLLRPSQESISEAKKCVLAIIAHQLQIMNEKVDKKPF